MSTKKYEKVPRSGTPDEVVGLHEPVPPASLSEPTHAPLSTKINTVIEIIVMVIAGLAFILTAWVALLGGSPIPAFAMAFILASVFVNLRNLRRQRERVADAPTAIELEPDDTDTLATAYARRMADTSQAGDGGTSSGHRAS